MPDLDMSPTGGHSSTFVLLMGEGRVWDGSRFLDLGDAQDLEVGDVIRFSDDVGNTEGKAKTKNEIAKNTGGFCGIYLSYISSSFLDNALILACSGGPMTILWGHNDFVLIR